MSPTTHRQPHQSDRPEGAFCIYTDGAFSSENQAVGVGLVIEDPFGFMIARLSTRPEALDAHMSEALGMTDQGALTSEQGKLLGLYLALSIIIEVKTASADKPSWTHRRR